MYATRRVLLFWLLLLLPTLGAGAGAFWLLKREQSRLDALATAASDSRRAAIEARARLIVENIELLVGDVQTGLMETLASVPSRQNGAFLDAWERNNPLVLTTFLLSPDLQIIRPSNPIAAKSVRSSLQSWLAATPPWRKAPSAAAKESNAIREQRRDVSSNVSSVQSARSAIKDEAGIRSAPEKVVELAASDQTGWAPWRDQHGLHLIGWRLPSDGSGAVIGVVMNLPGIRDRLEALLPRDGELANAFMLKESSARTPQETRYFNNPTSNHSPETTKHVAVPLAAHLLPGWEVVGGLEEGETVRQAGGGFLLIGGLLVVTFMMAILAGGTLLVGQARRSAEEAAQKTSFVTNVSHEFKTPLTTIRLYAELLGQGRVRDAAQSSNYLRIIGQETERLARLVNNALDFSRLEQGRKRFQSESVDLVTEVNRVLDTHGPQTTEHGLSLKRELPALPTIAQLDRDALEQILVNLLDNACKYAASGGELMVRLTATPERGARLEVSDRGPGVPVEHRERIFEKFHRVDEALTADKAGAGLGLSIARQLARGMGGDLRYEPTTGGGATFVVTLP